MLRLNGTTNRCAELADQWEGGRETNSNVGLALLVAMGTQPRSCSRRQVSRARVAPLDDVIPAAIGGEAMANASGNMSAVRETMDGF
ncbi:mitotic-spindle organizing protein 1 isoform X1 [Xenopus laevis]|uniref:Mitotic-spindle organizing protein 1 isoform X1 n=1 Tax=Xenopus laevis TaxID=8355 RepID=A0A8J1MDI5_XENLA|nr:mitotic-spindle organizing protein 1 isoform X1 [Xenopus laevis]